MTSIIILLAALSTSVLNVRQAIANPGLQVDDPGNAWSTRGPGIGNLLLKYFGSANGELTDFAAGKLDLTDTSKTNSYWGLYDINKDIVLSLMLVLTIS